MAGNELTQKDNMDLTTPFDWTQNIELIKETITKNLSPVEFNMFLAMAKMYKLNPLKREIYSIKYGDRPAQTIVGRDGYYQLAKETPGYDGYEVKEHLEWDTTNKPKDTSYVDCTVWIKGLSHPIIERAYLGEYNKGVNQLWKTMPITMLRKVAESRAFRRAAGAFGTYSEEEMSNSTISNPIVENGISKEQAKKNITEKF